MTNEIKDILKEHRQNIDALDDEIVSLLALRLQVVHRVAKVKHAHNIDPILQDRIDEVINRNMSMAENLGADPHLIKALYEKIIRHAIDVETKMIAEM